MHVGNLNIGQEVNLSHNRYPDTTILAGAADTSAPQHLLQPNAPHNSYNTGAPPNCCGHTPRSRHAGHTRMRTPTGSNYQHKNKRDTHSQDLRGIPSSQSEIFITPYVQPNLPPTQHISKKKRKSSSEGGRIRRTCDTYPSPTQTLTLQRKPLLDGLYICREHRTECFGM